jgi:hypothetical protein
VAFEIAPICVCLYFCFVINQHEEIDVD